MSARLLLASLVAGLSLVRAQTNATSTESVSSPETAPAAPIPAGTPTTNGGGIRDVLSFDYQAPAGPQVEPLRQAWIAEHDPKKRAELAAEVMEAIIHQVDHPNVEVADEVARDGVPANVLSPLAAKTVTLQVVRLMNGFQLDSPAYWQGPIFRRLAAKRFEAWTPSEGLLFDNNGKVLADAVPPRRGGHGREWYGAFLSNGDWLTTELDQYDGLLYAFDSTGKVLWSLAGKQMVNTIRAADPAGFGKDDYLAATTGWARADRTGRRWLICTGVDFTRGYALVSPRRDIHPLPRGTKVWNLIYPRSMGVRGMYTGLSIDSDDAKQTLWREEAGHGIGVGWPTYRVGRREDPTSNVEGNDIATIHEGTLGFGFWPHSGDVHLDSGGYLGESFRVWFFGATRKYQGEVAGQYLADAANGRDLLTQNNDGTVTTVRDTAGQIQAIATRQFKWSDGSPAIPLAFYDDLKLGFFLQGTNLVGGDKNTTTQARKGASIVLARW